MQDRYLFRGERIDNGEWVQGNLVNSVYKKNDTCVGTYGSNVGMHQVDPSTLCQRTGLEDKNGKLIWENDILSGHIDNEFPENETRKCVVWHKNGWCTNEPGCDYYEGLDDFDSENFEVIGNMIDNPELLEV